MATATLTDGPAVQLTFPWALPKAEEASPIVAERRGPSAPDRSARRARHTARRPAAPQVARVTLERHSTSAAAAATAEPQLAASQLAAHQSTAAASPAAQCASTLPEALCEDRIGKPFRMGAVMFRLLKRYGITDEEIAEGIAAYTAKRNATPAF